MITIYELVAKALQEIERKYGTGHNDGEFPLAYHNRKHTEDVIADITKLADLAIAQHHITLRQADLLHVAAAFHDIEQRSKEYGNELASADIMEHMSKNTFILSADELLEVREIILGTEVVRIHGSPQQIYAQTYLARLLADADLAALGKTQDSYIETSEALYREMFPVNNPSHRLSFLSQSLDLFKNHRYFTVEGEFLFPNQDKNLQYITSEYEKLQQR